MCTYHTEQVEVAGSGKGPDGWFPLRLACVYFDHPQHTPAEHTLNLDFLNPAQGPSARVAVELSRESALALADAIHAALGAANALETTS
jgi:hypothetical protein